MIIFQQSDHDTNPEQELLDDELRRYVRKYVDSLPIN